jgi:hypothetical protein
LDVNESQDNNILIKKIDANNREFLINHAEVADYLISNHNKNAENMHKNLLFKYDMFTKERLDIESNYENLYDCLDLIERKNSDLNIITKMQNNNENSKIKILKKCGLFI